MRALVYLLTFASVIGLGFWAYTENYATQQALKDVARLNAEIADLREALSIQRAEWAYLNRPDRLRELALPVILVVRLGLGCINHALPSVEAIERLAERLVERQRGLHARERASQ